MESEETSSEQKCACRGTRKEWLFHGTDACSPLYSGQVKAVISSDPWRVLTDSMASTLKHAAHAFECDDEQWVNDVQREITVVLKKYAAMTGETHGILEEKECGHRWWIAENCGICR